MKEKIHKSKEEWKKQLTPKEFEVMFEQGTEAPFSGKYYLSNKEGIYHCVACGNALFKSGSKFYSDCGWPAFFEPISETAVEYHEDLAHGMRRVEVTCWQCGAHLGHVFPDAPETPTGQRFCINSIALDLENNKNEDKK